MHLKKKNDVSEAILCGICVISVFFFQFISRDVIFIRISVFSDLWGTTNVIRVDPIFL